RALDAPGGGLGGVPAPGVDDDLGGRGPQRGQPPVPARGDDRGGDVRGRRRGERGDTGRGIREVVAHGGRVDPASQPAGGVDRTPPGRRAGEHLHRAARRVELGQHHARIVGGRCAVAGGRGDRGRGGRSEERRVGEE